MSIAAEPAPFDDIAGSPTGATVPGDQNAALFAWACWAFMIAQALFFVYHFGTKTPYIEDWYAVDLLTNNKDFTLSYLWEQVPRADHRVPILKALFYLEYKLFGIDVRPFLYLGVAMFAALAAGLMWAARRVRGTTSLADAFFPLILLTLGHGESFLWAEAFVYILCTCLVGTFLIIHVAWRSRLTPIPALVAGLCLAALPLTFGGGVTYVPFLGLWMAYAGFRLVRSNDSAQKPAGFICLFMTLVAFLVVAAYLTGYHRTQFDENETMMSTRLGPTDILKASLKYLAMSLGPAVRRPFWPLSGAIAPLLLLVSGIFVLLSLLKRDPARRAIALGLLFYMTAYLVNCLAVGVARGSWDPDYLFLPRYAASSVPVLFGIYFAWECCGPTRWLNFGRMVLFTVVASNLTLNSLIGVEAAWRTDSAREFEKDVRSKISIPRLISKYATVTHHQHEKIEAWLESLRDAKIGDYGNLPPNPKFKEVRLSLTPTSTHNVEWTNPTGRVTGERPFLVFNIGKPEFVCGLRIKYLSTNKDGLNPFFQVFTHGPGEPAGFGKDRYLHVDLPTGREIDVPIWIYKTIDQIRVHPDKRPCDFTIKEIVLLLPESDSERIPSVEVPAVVQTP